MQRIWDHNMLPSALGSSGWGCTEIQMKLIYIYMYIYICIRLYSRVQRGIMGNKINKEKEIGIM